MPKKEVTRLQVLHALESNAPSLGEANVITILHLGLFRETR